MSGKGIASPYGRTKALSKRITSSLIMERLRGAIDEPHIDLNVPIATIFPGVEPPAELLEAVYNYRDFVNDGIASGKGLKLSAVQNSVTLLDFEKAIEAWYKASGWTVI